MASEPQSEPGRMMKVEEFVAESLAQIVRGVRMAQKTMAEHGAAISPWESVTKGGTSYLNPVVEKVQFDISVVVSSAARTEDRLGVSQISDDRNAATHRLAFSIPVVLPRQPEGPKRG